MDLDKILTDAQKEAKLRLVLVGSNVALMDGERVVVTFAEEVPDWWIRRMADVNLSSKQVSPKPLASLNGSRHS